VSVEKKSTPVELFQVIALLEAKRFVVYFG
jgi:hypothetical protein